MFRTLLQQLRNNRGLSFLELLTVIGIIAIIATFTVPNLRGWKDKRDLKNGFQNLYNTFARMKGEAYSRNKTMRAQLTLPGAGGLTNTVYVANNTNQACSTTADFAAANWTVLAAWGFALDSEISITAAGLVADGEGDSNICFMADGTSTGGSLDIDSNPATTLRGYRLDVVLTTGFIDTLKENTAQSGWDQL